MFGGRGEAGAKGAYAVVGLGQGGCGGDVDVSLGGGMDGGEGGYGREGDLDRII